MEQRHPVGTDHLLRGVRCYADKDWRVRPQADTRHWHLPDGHGFSHWGCQQIWVEISVAGRWCQRSQGRNGEGLPGAGAKPSWPQMWFFGCLFNKSERDLTDTTIQSYMWTWFGSCFEQTNCKTTFLRPLGKSDHGLVVRHDHGIMVMFQKVFLN